MSKFPKISIIIPTYNCAALLPATCKAIEQQSYPQELLEKIIVDGGSTDGTLAVAQQYGWQVVDNPARSNLYGLPLGFAAAAGDLILHLDDDNVLDRPDWLRQMVAPFSDPTIVAAEPLFYSSPAKEDEITRYVGLIGADDPLVVYAGFHDKWSTLTNSWTGVPHLLEDRAGYLAVLFTDANNIPSLACNAFMARRSALLPAVQTPWLHMDGARRMVKAGSDRRWAKVKVGIVNHHAAGIHNFFVKKWRRMQTRSREAASFEYQYPLTATDLVKICLRCVFVAPLVLDAMRGFSRRPDPVWLLHPFLTIGTLVTYGLVYLRLQLSAGAAKPLRIVGSVRGYNFEQK